MLTAARGSVSPNVNNTASGFSSSSGVNDNSHGTDEMFVVHEAHSSGELREFSCTVRCLVDSGANVVVLKLRSLLWHIGSSTTNISAVNGTFDAPSGEIKAYLLDCPSGGMYGNAICLEQSGENIVPLEWLESYGYCVLYLGPLGALVVTPRGNCIQLERNPHTSLCMIDVEFRYKARERNVSLSTSIQGAGTIGAMERNGSTYDMDTDNIENDDDDFNSAMETNGSTDMSGNNYDTDTDNVEDNASSTIYTFSTTISNEVISTLARTGFPSTPWPSLALRARFARFREMQEVETLIIDSSAAFMRMNTILYADDVIVTSTDVTMRREEFEH